MAVVATHRPTKAIIHKEAIKANIKNELCRLNKGEELWAVVKADAYGHGLIEVAKVAKEAGATGFCVAYVDEGLALRQAGFTDPILVLGVTEPMATVVLACQNKLTLAAASLDWLQRAEKAVSSCEDPLTIHLIIDSGMGRIGFFDEEEMHKAREFLMNEAQSLKPEGIFTHFATADEKETVYFEKQQQRFTQALGIFGRDFRYIHTSNTATALWHEAWESNLIRFGVGMYGMNPSGSVLSLPYPLYPAMEIISEMVYVKQLRQGDSVSYGATYTAQEDEWIATLPIGYADGLLRAYSGFSVLVEGIDCPIVGRVTMDQIMIRLPKYFPVGTKVTIIGKSGEKENTFTQAAEHIGTINYELTSILGERLERIYVD